VVGIDQPTLKPESDSIPCTPGLPHEIMFRPRLRRNVVPIGTMRTLDELASLLSNIADLQGQSASQLQTVLDPVEVFNQVMSRGWRVGVSTFRCSSGSDA
jgi:hypothetical protein